MALFAGCCVIAVAVYLGLRARPASSPAPRPTVGPTEAHAARTTPASVAKASGANPIDKTRVQAAAKADVQAALAARKARWLETCWAPSVARQAQPQKAIYDFDVSFAADGRQIARGIAEHREFARTDVAQCLRAQPMDMRIPAPGMTIRATVRVEFP